MIAAIARIARVVAVPVSADIESGFAHNAREVAETVRRVIDAGAVGINLEDQVHDGSHSLYDYIQHRSGLRVKSRFQF
jgi:2-methylisocitrate lyase-like PEP mutase family enzyme